VTGASSRVGIRLGDRSRLPGRHTRRVPLCCRHVSTTDSRDRGGDQGGGGGRPGVEVGPAFDVELEGGQRAGGELLPEPSQHRPTTGQRQGQVLMPGLWAITMADDTRLGRRRSRSRSWAAPAPYSARSIRISRASPSAGRTAPGVSQVRSDEEHNTTAGRTFAASRWAARSSAARPPRGARGRPASGTPGLVPAGLGMAEQPEAHHSGASVVGPLGCRRDYGSLAGWSLRPGRIRVPPRWSRHSALDANLTTACTLQTEGMCRAG
jgi:hypothetical protein